VGAFKVGAADLDVDRRRQPEVEHRVDQAAGLEIGVHLGDLGRHPAAHAIHISVAADAVAFLQAALHEGGVLAGIAGIDR